MRKNVLPVVEVTCYGKKKTWNRSEAIAFFTKGVLMCDGSERERYAKIIAGLEAGENKVSDE